jgi:chaperonin GroES
MSAVVQHSAEKPEAPTDIKGDPSQLPKPTGFRMLVAPMQAEEKTEGGIFITDERRAQETSASIVACVMELGSDCYKDKKKFPDGAWCEKGDWVLIGSYSGMSITIHGMEFRIINDDNVHATVEDPRGVSRQ